MHKSDRLALSFSYVKKEDFAEFMECIEDLLELEDVQRLADFAQHMKTNRFQHSVNVSLAGFYVSKKLGLDYRSAARAGLLHDLFLYDWRYSKQPEGNHAAAHPRVALRTAKKNVKLNKIEENAILRHMWPLTITPPKYKEAFVISMVDKYCCIQEVAESLLYKGQMYFQIYKAIYSGGSYAK